jgi:DNA-binding MarR family transcriptional regulator
VTTAGQGAIQIAMAEVRRFTAAMFHRSGNSWADLELTMAQFKALFTVVTTGGVHGRELAAILGISPSSVSTIIDHLVERGLVYREEDTVDRRITHNRPTPAGIVLFEQLTSARDEQLAAVFQRLNPEELALVTEALRVLRRTAEAIAAETPLGQVAVD